MDNYMQKTGFTVQQYNCSYESHFKLIIENMYRQKNVVEKTKIIFENDGEVLNLTPVSIITKVFEIILIHDSRYQS
jgi:hypothetical protein